MIDPAPWTVTRSRQVLRDPWIDVRADDCVTAEGAVVAPYYVLDYPDWVQVVALDADDRLLMVEQYRHGLGIVSLELPTGAIDAADRCPLDAARRELLEETGHGGGDWSAVATLAPNPATHTNRCHVFLASGVRCQRAPVDDPTERLRLRPMAVEGVVAKARAGDIAQAMHVAALALALTSIGRW